MEQYFVGHYEIWISSKPVWRGQILLLNPIPIELSFNLPHSIALFQVGLFN